MSRWFHEMEMTVPFFDCDPMQVVWHGHYLKYFEICRQVMLDKLGYGYFAMRESGYLWPVVDVRLKYVRPAVLQQKLTVRAEIVEYENRLKVEYVITSNGEKLTRGYTVQVAVNAKTNELEYVTPPELWKALGVS
ncbi:MAG: acyl-CoA thioesterase [Archangium sp.]